MSPITTIFITIFGIGLVTAGIQRRNSPPCIGCPVEGDVNDADLKILLTQVLAEKDAGTEIVAIKKVTKQVVAGTKYVVEFEAKSGNAAKTCDCTFVHQPWLEKKINVLDFSCH